jgi:hypothetical protein
MYLKIFSFTDDIITFTITMVILFQCGGTPLQGKIKSLQGLGRDWVGARPCRDFSIPAGETPAGIRKSLPGRGACPCRDFPIPAGARPCRDCVGASSLQGRMGRDRAGTGNPCRGAPLTAPAGIWEIPAPTVAAPTGIGQGRNPCRENENTPPRDRVGIF